MSHTVLLRSSWDKHKTKISSIAWNIRTFRIVFVKTLQIIANLETKIFLENLVVGGQVWARGLRESSIFPFRVIFKFSIRQQKIVIQSFARLLVGTPKIYFLQFGISNPDIDYATFALLHSLKFLFKYIPGFQSFISWVSC